MKKRFLGSAIVLLALAALVGLAVQNTGNGASLLGAGDSAGPAMAAPAMSPYDERALSGEAGGGADDGDLAVAPEADLVGLAAPAETSRVIKTANLNVELGTGRFDRAYR